jgi:hypothetical protein
VDEEVGGFEGVLGVVRGADPQEAIEVDAGGGGGCGVEGIFGVDEGADFFAMGGLGEDGEQQAGAAGGSRSEDFGEAAAGESSGGRVELGDAGGDTLGGRAGLPVQVAAEEGFELFLEGYGGHYFRFLFALTIFLPDEGVGVNGVVRPRLGIQGDGWRGGLRNEAI